MRLKNASAYVIDIIAIVLFLCTSALDEGEGDGSEMKNPAVAGLRVWA